MELWNFLVDNKVFSLLIGAVGVCIAIKLPAVFDNFWKLTHRISSENELKLHQKKLESLFAPIVAIFLSKTSLWRDGDSMKTNKLDKTKDCYKQCVMVEPLSQKEVRAINALLKKYNSLMPDVMRDAWAKYRITENKSDLALFYEILAANYNWNRRCVGLDYDRAKTNPKHIPKRPETYATQLRDAVYFGVYAVCFLFVTFIVYLQSILLAIIPAILFSVCTFMCVLYGLYYYNLHHMDRI